MSDSAGAFAQALEERGLYLARGDRRAHVAVTYEGEVLSIARMTGKKAKEVTAKLGPPEHARSVAETRDHIASVIQPKLNELIATADQQRSEAMKPLNERRLAMKQAHTSERERMDKGQAQRREAKFSARTDRLRTGVMGLWDRLTGRHTRTIKQNELEAVTGLHRDRAQRDALVGDQLNERRSLQRDMQSVRHRHAANVLELHRDLAHQERSRAPSRDGAQKDGLAKTFERATNAASPGRTSGTTRIMRARGSERGASRSGPRGPGLGR